MLTGTIVLIAEDQAFIALDLSLAVQDAGGQVTGPVASAQAALDLTMTLQVTGAIVDFNLTDGDVTPVIAALIAANIPVVVQSGVGLPDHVAARFPGLVVCIKPFAASELVTKLSALISAKREAASA